MPIADRAPYLGTNMSAKGNPHFEISTRIINTTTTLNELALFWKRAPVSTTWKLRVHDAVISSKLSYGLEPASLTNAEYERLDAFQIHKGSNEHVGNTTFIPPSRKQRSCDAKNKPEDKAEGRQNNYEDVGQKKLINWQMQFMAHLLRAKEDDIIKTCTTNRNGLRISAGFKRTGKPRIKWYDQVMNSVSTDSSRWVCCYRTGEKI